MDDLNDILVFTHVADLGSFTAAAARLSLPKSSVSARYHEHARRMILELQQAAATVERFRSRPSGSLRISASVVMGQARRAGLGSRG